MTKTKIGFNADGSDARKDERAKFLEQRLADRNWQRDAFHRILMQSVSEDGVYPTYKNGKIWAYELSPCRWYVRTDNTAMIVYGKGKHLYSLKGDESYKII